MGQRIELRFREALVELVPAGSTVLAAVSGGGDSVALLHLLVRVSPGLRQEVVVAHLDHGLRRGSVAERRFVERLARDLQLRCIADRREVDRMRRRDESPEEAARRVRRAFLLEAAATASAAHVATGHTLDDQAETVLMRLVRGAGATALTGMAAAGPGPFVRPLIGIERAELRGYLERRGLRYRQDPSNRDLRFDRNRVRRLVLPVLVDALNPRAARHLVKAAERFREDAVYLDGLAEELTDRLCVRRRTGQWAIDAAGLRDAPAVLGRRVARLALMRAGADARRLGTRHIDALLRLAGGPGGAELHLPGALVARKRGGSVVLAARS